jgi:HK97 family phage major capsid protein
MELNRILSGEHSEKPEPILKTLEKQRDKLKALNNAGNGSISFTLKNVTRGSIAGSTIAMRDTEIGQLPTLQPQLMPLFSRGTVSPNNNGVIRYIEQASFTNNAAPVAEGALKPSSNATWAEKLVRIETIAHSIAVTRQALDDLEFMASELDELLRLYLSLKIDQQLYSGSGTSPELRGAYTAAPAFNGVPYAITSPTLYDLVVAVASDITENKDRQYQPTVALMNPRDVLRYKLGKGSDGHYLLPPFVGGDGNEIAGIQVIPTGRVAQNTMLVGDFRFGRVYMDGDITVRTGWIDNQFLTNQVTLLAEVKIALLIKDVNADAFRKVTDIQQALADIAP